MGLSTPEGEIREEKSDERGKGEIYAFGKMGLGTEPPAAFEARALQTRRPNAYCLVSRSCLLGEFYAVCLKSVFDLHGVDRHSVSDLQVFPGGRLVVFLIGCC